MSSRLVETHTATLLFDGDRVYKRKKALDLGFLDFRTVEARRRACEDEVRLNRRLSPDVYLGVAEVRDPDGRPCDSLVVMRALPPERSLAHLARTGADVRAALHGVAEQLAALHRSSPAPDRLAELGTPQWQHDLWDTGLDALVGFEDVVPADVRERTRVLAHRWYDGRGPLLAERAAAGRLVDGHGDLQAEDVFVLEDGPRVLDCLEFDERLRVGDGLADAAFLAMDLERLGAPELGQAFLDDYRALAADDAPRSLAHAFVAYRAHIRCKVACIRARQDPSTGAAAEARLLAGLALRHLEAAQPRLVLVGGLPGSGKSTVARALGERAGWQVLSSDLVRKAQAGLRPDERGDEALYDPARTDATYAALCDRAEELLGRGAPVVLDATWADTRHRALARAVADRCAARLVELRCEVDQTVAAERLGSRPPGPSDATPDVLAAMADRFAPWPEAVGLDTSRREAETVAVAWGTLGPLDAGTPDPGPRAAPEGR